jgi:hypothetical protein
MGFPGEGTHIRYARRVLGVTQSTPRVNPTRFQRPKSIGHLIDLAGDCFFRAGEYNNENEMDGSPI